MKQLIFVALIFLTVFCISCNNNKTDATNNKSEPGEQNTFTSSSPGDAVFSYNLDGTKISGGDVDELQTSNIASVTKSSDNSNELVFFLNDAEKENTDAVSHSLRFTIPGKTGNVALTAGEDHWNVELFLATGQEGKYVIYGNEAFNITVTNISTSRVSGTFWGKEKIAPGQSQGKNEVTITDGKFDIPVRPDTH